MKIVLALLCVALVQAQVQDPYGYEVQRQLFGSDAIDPETGDVALPCYPLAGAENPAAGQSYSGTTIDEATAFSVQVNTITRTWPQVKTDLLDKGELTCSERLGIEQGPDRIVEVSASINGISFIGVIATVDLDYVNPECAPPPPPPPTLPPFGDDCHRGTRCYIPLRRSLATKEETEPQQKEGQQEVAAHVRERQLVNKQTCLLVANTVDSGLAPPPTATPPPPVSTGTD